MMKMEIGSEFWTGCTPLTGTGVASLLPDSMEPHYTLCGRTALELVLRDAVRTRTIHKAYLPAYCCHTMIEPFVAKGIELAFYDVFFTDWGIDSSFEENNDCDLVFLIDYFGFREGKNVQIAQTQKALGKCVVYDATHSLFCKNVNYSAYDYVFGSFRKWFGVNAGFCAKRGNWFAFPNLTQHSGYCKMRHVAFLDKQQFMEGKSIEKQQFLDAFYKAEEILETDYVGYAPDAVSLQILGSVNVDFVRQKRAENASYAIKQINALESVVVSSPRRWVESGECPLFVPLQVAPQHRMKLRRLLIENNIYLPIHWPLSDLHQTNEISRQIYDRELSFVCDQRYGLKDMERAIEIIRSF